MYKPRQSGIPTPGRPSGIPTPGRSRSSSVAGQNAPAPQHDVDAISRAFAEAIKANDPSQHRNSRASDMSSVASLSPPAASFSGSSRPSSVASVSRPKTPSYARPLSRQSERSSSRAGTRPFELGDNVRVESLGFEGALRFIGEIDGKPGLWAGVELSGGFAGKGKNDGSVGGKQYFSCPAKCGVFVATTKLSAPTVGFGASHRPSSVSGRITPGLNGRMTPSTSFRSTTSSRPSLSNGRITPSGRVTPANNGRITPSSVSETPSARAARLRALAKKPTTSLPPVPSVSKTPTPGTRASKYASMTAKQLSTIHGTPDSKIASPGGIARSMSSPIRSPFATPKPRIPTSGPGTPRARIPSAVAMPPPPAPSSPSRSASASLNGTAAVSAADLDQRSRELQARIASLTGASRASEDNDFSATEVDLPRYRTPSAPSSPRRSETTSPRMPSSPRRPQSSFGGPTHRATSSVSSITNERVDALLDENERLRSDLERMKEDVERAKEERENDQHTATLRAVAAAEELEKLNEEKRQVVETSQTRITELEAALKAADDAKTQLTLHHSTSIAERDQTVKDLEATKGGLEIDVGKLKKTVVDLEDERHDLLSQVDELRQAGQETIALYEERLRACDVRRYELEDNIADLEARVREAPARDQSVSPSSTAATLVSGTEIDNETLRDQIIHLQKKIATLEDIIEDSRAAAEKEEAALRDRMRRVKEKEDAMRREVNESKREVQMGIEREEMAKRRTEEVEEAFRESTVALENARAEVEGLRVDLDHLNGLVSSASEGSMSSKVQEITNRASMDKDEYTGEIARLRQLLDDAQATGDSELIRKNEELQEMAEEQILKMSELQEKIEDQAQELDALKKKLNRDVTINAPGTPSKHDLSAARDEIKGLKHIVRQLQEEAVVSSQKQKTLESENQLLMSEMDQLRQEVKILEENIDQSIMREEAELSGAAAGTDVDVKALKLKFETETEQLRKRMTDAEMKTARVTHDLNKEISELEALVETKIYREDELEQEIDRLKDKLSRKKSSSSSSYAPSTYHAGGSTTSLSSSNGTIATNGEPVCEICERPGHDIFNCDLLKEGSSTPSAAPKVSKEELFCEDCEGYGHLPVDCPHSADVF